MFLCYLLPNTWSQVKYQTLFTNIGTYGDIDAKSWLQTLGQDLIFLVALASLDYLMGSTNVLIEFN